MRQKHSTISYRVVNTAKDEKITPYWALKYKNSLVRIRCSTAYDARRWKSGGGRSPLELAKKAKGSPLPPSIPIIREQRRPPPPVWNSNFPPLNNKSCWNSSYTQTITILHYCWPKAKQVKFCVLISFINIMKHFSIIDAARKTKANQMLECVLRHYMLGRK